MFERRKCMITGQKKVSGLTTSEKARANTKATEIAMKDKKLTAQQAKKIAELMDIAKMPIVLKDGDITMGEGEVDIRKLSHASLNQMMFRLMILNNLYLKDIATSFVDVLKLFMVVLDKYGVEDIAQAVEDLENKLKQQDISKKK